MNGQYGSTASPACRVASSTPAARIEPNPRPSKRSSTTVCVRARAAPVRRYSAYPATSPPTSSSNRPASTLSTTCGVSSVTVASYCRTGSTAGALGRTDDDRNAPVGHEPHQRDQDVDRNAQPPVDVGQRDAGGVQQRRCLALQVTSDRRLEDGVVGPLVSDDRGLKGVVRDRRRK